jgi:ribosome biogenesis GTPase A
VTTDPDRILALAPAYGQGSSRLPVKAALTSPAREDVVVALARETDRLQQKDRARLDKYRQASENFLRAFQASKIGDLDLPEAHDRICELAERWLPRDPLAEGDVDHGAAE